MIYLLSGKELETMKRRLIQLFTALIIMIILAFIQSPLNLLAAEPSIESGAAILMDADTGHILYQRNINKQFYPASITKIMTALLAIENGNMNDMVTMSRNAVFSIERGSSHIALDTNEEIRLEQLFNALLLASANDAANGIAEHIGGSLEEFANMMTLKAKALGAKNTTFKNAHGLYNPNHVTTAYDMALIAREIFKYPKFINVINRTKTYTIPPTNKQKDTRYLANQHKMLRTNYKYYSEDVIGGKTGYTDQSRHTLVTFAKKDGVTLISVILKAQSQNMMYKDTYNLIDFGYNQVKKIALNKANQVIERIPVYNNLDPQGEMCNKLGYVDLIATEDFIYYGDKDINKKDIVVQYQEKEGIIAPISKNDVIGNLSYKYQGTVLGTVPLIAGQTYEQMDTTIISSVKESLIKIPKTFKLQYLVYYILVFVVAVIFLIILLTLRRRRKKRRPY